MRLDFGLHLEQSQKLIMTPELRQAIKILQMSSLELSQFVDQQVQENPLLEFDEGGERGGLTEVETGENREKSSEEYDVDWQEYFHDSSDLGYPVGQREEINQENSFENFTTKAPTLFEHLTFQLAISNCPTELVDIVQYLIGNLDASGYLKITVGEAAEELEQSPEKVAQALEVLQSMEPAGVGARDLKECLMLQVKHLGLRNKILEELINNYLPDLAKGRIDKIAAELQVNIKEVQQAADQLKFLDPKPGRNFSNYGETRFIVPDVVVEKIENEYIILVNDITAPRIKVNNFYRQAVQKNNQNIDRDTRKYVEAKLNSALWLVRSIEQRRLTLYRVAKELVEQQRNFLDHGIKYLKPLGLKEVAGRLGLHESTVSRATANKYMQTPRGVFEMKYFFSTGIKSKEGSQVSTKSIKKMLQEIIAQEDPQRPYSDQKIADLLEKQGVKISRRTVTKYRDELQIPSASRRKRY